MTKPGSDLLRFQEQCAASECEEMVGFTLLELANDDLPMRFSGTCAVGHRNMLTPHDLEQWIVQPST